MTAPRSREIIEIVSDVVARTSVGCILTVADGMFGVRAMECPAINYTFGNAQYVKDRLDEMSKSQKESNLKFPLIALFCPFKEKRDSVEYYSKATVNVLIACATKQQYSNEQRRTTSFGNVLRPVYRRFLEALVEDGRLDFGYDGHVSHEYSENYSYGKYGAYTGTGDCISEPIDAINISNLTLTVKNQNCREQ